MQLIFVCYFITADNISHALCNERNPVTADVTQTKLLPPELLSEYAKAQTRQGFRLPI